MKTVNTTPDVSLTRRNFLRGAGTVSLLTGATALGVAPNAAHARTAFGTNAHGAQRAAAALRARIRQAVLQHLQRPSPVHPTNGDEQRYSNFIGNFGKALPHDSNGVVDPNAYRALLRALQSAAAGDFEAIPMGGAIKLADPQAAYAYQLEGGDSHGFEIPAPPAFASEAQAGEMADLYWQALARDVPFSRYGQESITAAAVADLRRFAGFSQVNAGNLFRGIAPGETVGPYISQFLYHDIPYGPTTITQQYKVPMPGQYLLSQYGDWVNIQRGHAPNTRALFDATPRYLRNGRDLAEYVHRDFSYQAFLNAALILLGMGGAALDPANPYRGYARQGSFITFGGPDILGMVAQVAGYALKAAWFQKWLVHRRVRPEAFGGSVQSVVGGVANYPVHSSLLQSAALQTVLRATGTALLPMAYEEGCPCHPAYPAGHAAIAGACVTVLKAFFNEALPMTAQKVASEDGMRLDDYTGTQLTVGGELNKLAANISLGRDIAGVHWQSDGIEGMRLGEAVAIAYLSDIKTTYSENFGGFALTKFDGSTVTV